MARAAPRQASLSPTIVSGSWYTSRTWIFITIFIPLFILILKLRILILTFYPINILLFIFIFIFILLCIFIFTPIFILLFTLISILMANPLLENTDLMLENRISSKSSPRAKKSVDACILQLRPAQH